jgi:hypothetical protein
MREWDQSTRRNHVLAFILFVILTVLMTWPVIARLGTHLAGGRDDLWVHQWTFWWVREALRDGLNPFFTPYLYAPIGASLTSHNIAWFNIALWLPLQALFGRITAYNLVFLAVITLNGFCMYLFAWQEIRSFGASLIAGIIFGFWPYTLSHYDHANMMVLFWVPVTLLLLYKMISRNGQEEEDQEQPFQWWLVLGTAFSLAMVGITRWQLLIMSGPILIGYPLYLLWKFPRARNRGTLFKVLSILGIALVLMAPLATPLVIDQFTREFPEDVFLDEAIWGRTDLLAYFVPSIHNGLWHERVATIYEKFVVNQFYTPFLGFITLLLAAVGIFRRWRQAWIWLILALLYFILALGPELAINGRSYPAVPMPYRLVEDFFLLRLIRRPDRLNLFLSLPVALLAGWGMDVILSALSKITVRLLVLSAAVLLILLAYNPIPFATTASVVPQWLAQRAGEGEQYTILDLPVDDRSYDKWYMAYQTFHGKPIATGHVSRLPRESMIFLDSIPFLANLKDNDQLPDPDTNDIGRQLKLLANGGVKYLIIHKQFANEGLQAIWRNWLVIDPAYEDDELIVYNTALKTGRDFNFEHQITDEIGLVKADLAPIEGVQGGVITVNTVWGTTAVPQQNLDACFTLTGKGQIPESQVCQVPDIQAETTTWAANDLRRASYILPVANDLGAGEYDLTLTLADTATGEQVGEPTVLGTLLIHPFSPELNTAVTWENDIHLLGADFQESAENLELTLYWQAGHVLNDSYKVFLHFREEQSGEIAAQSDAIPRNWSYPTTNWQPGEIVRDVINIPLSSLTNGPYTILVGLYDEQIGERLTVLSADENEQTDAYELTTWDH